MTTDIAIGWRDGEVTGRLDDQGSDTGVLLAPGAGAGQDHPFMVAIRSGLAERGITTLTFDYAYKHVGRKAPDRMPKLLDVHAAAAGALLARVPQVVLAGKSMGGRVGSHLVGGTAGEPGRLSDGVVGLVYLGYPFVPIGKAEPRPVDHLRAIDVPQLFLAGSRDRFGPLELVEPVVASLPDARLHVIDDADHGFHVPKRTGRTDAEVREILLESTARFVADLVQASGGT